MAQHPRFALDATPLTNGAAIRATLGGGQTTGGFLRQPAASAGWASAAARPLPSGPSSAPVSASDSHNTVALARAAVAAAQENLTEQLARYTPAHPDVRAAQAALARANERLAAVQAGVERRRAAGAPVEHAAADSGSASSVAAAAAGAAAHGRALLRRRQGPSPRMQPVPVSKRRSSSTSKLNG